MQLSLRSSDPGAGPLTDPAFNSAGPIRRATYCTSPFLFGLLATEGAQLVSKDHQNNSGGINNSVLKSGADLSVCVMCVMFWGIGDILSSQLQKL